MINKINKKNLPLILGFSIPIVMILFVAASIYIPGIFSNPKYNFLYSSGQDYYSRNIYQVRNGKLIQVPQPTPSYRNYTQYQDPPLYIHNVKTNESTYISFTEALSLHVDTNSESPDGYKIEDGQSSSGFFPFFWYDRNYYSKYIVGHNVSRKMNIIKSGANYYDSIQFLGWIIE